MKPIYDCLDYLLDHLYENRFRPEGQRTPFDVDNKVMPELELTNHHEFRGLIDMLVEDKTAFFLDGWKDDLDHYRKRVMITPKGIDFHFKKGYNGKANRDASENTRLTNLENKLRANRKWILWLTIILTIGTLAQALYALAKLYWEHGWFQSVK